MKPLKSLLTTILVALSLLSISRDGMWIPSLIGAVYDDMKAYGLQLTAEDLYSINEGSLKDAVVLFGGGCTAEMVSAEGLMFTNHHCGLDYIQSHSSLEHDYIRDGFWAMSREEELPCPGLTATFVIRMEDVTASMLAGITSTLSAEEADKIKAANKKSIEEKAKKDSGYDAMVKAFNYGNQYFLILTRTYRDVRLVGAPPAGVGKFGGDLDNWVWPRHTGDFSIFRVYASENNAPAEYSASNKPYVPGHYFPISLDGVHEGDFTMVYGFPGRTEQYLSSYAVDYVLNTSNPLRIKMRDASLAVIDQRMRTSDQIRIQYIGKQSDIANAWKKWKGQELGLERFDVVNKKKQEEQELTGSATDDLNEFQTILPAIGELYASNRNVLLARDAYVEYVFYGPEIFAFAQGLESLTKNLSTLEAEGKLKDEVEKLKASARVFYKNFDLETERQVFNALTPIYMSAVQREFGPGILDAVITPGKAKAGVPLADLVYGKTMFTDSTKYFLFLDKLSSRSVKKLEKDPVYRIARDLSKMWLETLRPQAAAFTAQHDRLMERYVRALRTRFPERLFVSDANSTLRISYGKVEGSAPHDGMVYTHFTTSDGILDKARTGHPDYEIPERLRTLLSSRQFGAYGEDGKLHIAYTGSNHTTGGNSGSPALDAQGRLVGINFDRSWESTMSDIYYSPQICRNIMVDIRYVIWMIDIYANADHLLRELTLVKKGSDGPESR